jgi:hypothetical protein
MKKLFLVLMLATLMCLTLAVAVSAEAYTYDFGEVEHIDYFEKYAENNGKDYISVAMQNPQATSKESRVCVSCSCEKGKHTYPTYYFMSINPALTTLFNRDYQAINDNNPCGMTYGNNNILAVEVPEGCTDFWGDKTDKGTFYQHTSLVYVKIPLSLSNLSVNSFKGCTALEWVDFGENNKIKTLGNSTFNGCSSLKGACLPDSITYMNNATFIGCLNLGPVHLPDSLISFGDNPQWSTFQGGENGNGSKCTKLFFTNERFDNPDEVEKPEVYYMPSKFASCGDQLFRGCSNINDVIVFPTTYKAVGDFRSFIGYGGTADNPKTVIFLGDMSDFKGYADKTSSYMNFVFANPNDTVGNFNPTFTFDGSHADIIMYSCASGQAGRAYQTSWSSDLFKHFADVRKSEEITHGNCTETGTVQTYCFCGAEMGVVDGTTDPNAHEFDTDKNAIVVGVQYVSFDKNGTRTIKCARCTETSTDSGALPIITTKGYSVKNDGTGIDGGYIINLGALELYESLVSNAKIGIIIANAENVGSLTKVENGEYVLATEKGIMVELSSREYSSFNMALNGFTPESASKLNLVICAYVIADYDNDSETANTIKYIQHGIESSEDELVEVTPGVSLYTLTLEKMKAYLSKKD